MRVNLVHSLQVFVHGGLEWVLFGAGAAHQEGKGAAEGDADFPWGVSGAGRDDGGLCHSGNIGGDGFEAAQSCPRCVIQAV